MVGTWIFLFSGWRRHLQDGFWAYFCLWWGHLVGPQGKCDCCTGQTVLRDGKSWGAFTQVGNAE